MRGRNYSRYELLTSKWYIIWDLMDDEIKREIDETTELDVTKTGYLKRYCEIDPAFNVLLWKAYGITVNAEWVA